MAKRSVQHSAAVADELEDRVHVEVVLALLERGVVEPEEELIFR